MLTLNLVSQELKQEIKLKLVYNLLKKMDYVLIIIAVIVAIILSVAKLILQNNFNKIVAQTTLITKNNQGYNSKVREINSRLNFTAQIQNDFIAWSKVIENLAKLTPDNITFSLIKIDKTKQSIIIKGKAILRDSLLLLKQGMEESPIYQEIEFPVKNILQKENVVFEINAKLNLEAF